MTDSGAKKMRILQLLAHRPKKLGSIERWFLRIARGARERGHEVTLGLAWPTMSPSFAEALRELGVRVWVDRPSSLVDLAFLWRLVDFIRRERINVVHTHFSPVCHFGNLAAWLVGVPGRFWHIHSMSGITPNLPASLRHVASQRLSARLVVRIFSDSEAIREDFSRLGVPYGKVAVLPIGIDVGQFHLNGAAGTRARIRSSLGVPNGATLVGTVSRAEPVKGLEYLVEAAAQVAAVRPDVQWLVVGGGSQMQELHGLADVLGVAQRMIFEGIREDVPEVLQAMDIFVLPSLSEGFPLAAMEAMASGLPVVCSRVGGLPELVSHEETGLLVPPGDATALAEGVLRLVADGTLRQRLAGRASLEVGRYDNVALCDRLFDVYEETVVAPVVPGRGPGRSRV